MHLSIRESGCKHDLKSVCAQATNCSDFINLNDSFSSTVSLIGMSFLSKSHHFWFFFLQLNDFSKALFLSVDYLQLWDQVKVKE